MRGSQVAFVAAARAGAGPHTGKIVRDRGRTPGGRFFRPAPPSPAPRGHNPFAVELPPLLDALGTRLKRPQIAAGSRRDRRVDRDRAPQRRQHQGGGVMLPAAAAAAGAALAGGGGGAAAAALRAAASAPRCWRPQPGPRQPLGPGHHQHQQRHGYLSGAAPHGGPALAAEETYVDAATLTATPRPPRGAGARAAGGRGPLTAVFLHGLLGSGKNWRSFSKGAAWEGGLGGERGACMPHAARRMRAPCTAARAPGAATPRTRPRARSAQASRCKRRGRRGGEGGRVGRGERAVCPGSGVRRALACSSSGPRAAASPAAAA
jgi:hypothetical protein